MRILSASGDWLTRLLSICFTRTTEFTWCQIPLTCQPLQELVIAAPPLAGCTTLALRSLGLINLHLSRPAPLPVGATMTVLMRARLQLLLLSVGALLVNILQLLLSRPLALQQLMHFLNRHVPVGATPTASLALEMTMDLNP